MEYRSGRKVALVTGSTRGIGFVTALALKKSGHLIIINSRRKREELSPSLQKLILAAKGMDYVEGDVTREEEVEKIFQYIKERYGRLDVLVNNSGYSEHKSFIRLNQTSVTEMLHGNLTSAILCSKQAVRCMLPQKSGRIIQVSSTAGLHGMPFEAHYSAAKAGLVGLAKSIAKEYGTKGITCNVVAPGVMDKKDLLHQNQPESMILDRIALRRKGKLEEVASLIDFLASENAAYITGQVIQIDGGLYL